MVHRTAHLVDKVHLCDKQTLERVESAVMLSVIGTGLAVCAFGAIAFDIVHLFGSW